MTRFRVNPKSGLSMGLTLTQISVAGAPLCVYNSTSWTLKSWHELSVAAFDDEHLRMVQAPGKSNVVPAGVGDTREITWLERVDCASEVRPREVLHVDGLGHRGGRWPCGCLIIIHLSDKYRIDTLYARILFQVIFWARPCRGISAQEQPRTGPQRPYLTTGPALETCGIETINHGNVVKQDVANISK